MSTNNLWIPVQQAILNGQVVIVRSDFDDCAARTDLLFPSAAREYLESAMLSAMAERLLEAMLQFVEIGGHEGLPQFYEIFPTLLDSGWEHLKAGQVYFECHNARVRNTVLMDGFSVFVSKIGELVWVTANHRSNVFAGNQILSDTSSVCREDMFSTGDKSEGTGPWDLSYTRFPGTSVCLENSRRNAEASRNAYPFFLIDLEADVVSFENNIIVVPSWECEPLELIAIAAAM